VTPDARLLTGLVAGGLMAAAVLSLPTAAVAAVLGLFAVLAGWEWGRLAGLAAAPRWAYVLLVGSGLAPLWTLVAAEKVGPVLAGALLWWLAAALWEARPAIGRARSRLALVLKLAGGLLALWPAWTALVWLHASGPRGPLLLLYVLALVWAADSGAYYVGRRWGRRRMAPVLSPGKTWEGLAGGLAASAVVALGAGLATGLRGAALAGWVGLGLATATASVVGDLFESLLKRHAGVKDSGTLFPGHGGVLDRVDSLTAAAPVFAVGLRWL